MHQSLKSFLHRRLVLWCCLLPIQSLWLFNSVQGQSTCILSLNEIEGAESLITDFSVQRVYTLCPQTTFTIGRQDYFGTIQYETGSNMIHLRPNLHIQCGDDGARTNACIVTGGTIQVDGTSFFMSNSNTTDGAALTNVRMTGITFTNVDKYHVWIDQPGDVHFHDCSFQDSTDAILPIFLDHFDPTNLASVLNVTIQQCEFADIRYYGIPAQAALIVGNSKQNRLFITDSTFLRNDMIFNNTNFERASFLIESSGPVDMLRNCFQHNSIGVAPVGVYGSALLATDNFQYNSTGGMCQLSAYFTASSYAAFAPICASFDSPSCKAIIGDIVPTSAPIPTTTTTLTPTTIPETNSTTFSPTAVPQNISVPSLVPTPALVVGNVTNGTAPSPASAPTSNMVFWSAAPVIVNVTESPMATPAEEVEFNTTSSSSASSVYIQQHSTWLFVVFGVISTMECFRL